MSTEPAGLGGFGTHFVEGMAWVRVRSFGTGVPPALHGAVWPLRGAYVVWALLLAAVLPWRSGTYFDGGIDSVVLAKAVISLIALGSAAYLARDRAAHWPVAASPMVQLLAYLSVTVLGGYAHGTFGAAAVVAVRLLILCAAVSLLVARYSVPQATRALVHILAVVVISGTLSGLGTYAATGRLHGVLPSVHPNELALLASVCCLWLLVKITVGRERPVEVAFALGALGVVLLTGSRTALAAVCLAGGVMATRTRALTRSSFITLAMLGPTLAYVALGTDLASSLSQRGGQQSVETLSNRTIAWTAALTTERDLLGHLFGAGLAQKHIEVTGQWWTRQLLDSSWISAIIQGGLIGLLIVAILVIATMVRAIAQPGPAGTLWLGMVVYLAGRAVLESGLFDSSTSFLLLLLATFGARVDSILPPTGAREAPT